MPAHTRHWLLMPVRCGFLLILLSGVAFYGGTQNPSQTWLEWALLCVCAAYALATLVSGRGFYFGKILPTVTLLLVGLGWLSASNPTSAYEQELRLFIPVSPPSWWPQGTVDGDFSIATMRRISGILAALLVARDLSVKPHWRRAMQGVMAWSGAGVAIFGLTQRLSGDVGNYWGTFGTKLLRDTVFGPFWYHGNAGAFLNLCWPLMVVQVWGAARGRALNTVISQADLALRVTALLVVLTAIWVNHSRAAQAVFVVQCLAAVIIGALRSRGEAPPLSGSGFRHIMVLGMVALAVVGGMALAFGISAEKWQRLAQGGLTTDVRWAAMRTCVKLLPQVPFMGFGPGTFQAVFVVLTTDMSDAPLGYWQFAHNDYLQTWIEWGWVGALGWFTLGASTLSLLAHYLCLEPRHMGPEHHLATAATFVSLISVAFHAAVDFPLQIFAIQLYTAVLAGTGLGMIAIERKNVLGREVRHQAVFHRHESSRDQAGAP